MNEIAAKMKAILDENHTLEGCKIRWTSAKHRLQLTGTIVGAKMKRQAPMFLVDCDKSIFGQMWVPFHLIRSIQNS